MCIALGFNQHLSNVRTVHPELWDHRGSGEELDTAGGKTNSRSAAVIHKLEKRKLKTSRSMLLSGLPD